jgi:hypothetical protein
MSGVDFALAWRTAIPVWGAIIAVIILSLYVIVQTMEAEHEFAIDEEDHLEKLEKHEHEH